jgi:dethiobiotin synthetase
MRTAPGLFVTGTDTEVGKTLVSVSLVRALVAHGLRVAVMKPIASGSMQTPDGLRNADALALAEASNVQLPYAAINPYCFEPSISPHIAAEEAGIEVRLSLIRDRFEALASGADVVVVEGAGGWYAPVNELQSMADLPRLLDIPVLLVVGLRLGCLNHALLSWKAIEASGAQLGGWVANCIDPRLERKEANLSTLERKLGCEPLAVFPFEPDGPACVRCGEQMGRRLSLISF